jgi:trimeric autotransporter adhesin
MNKVFKSVWSEALGAWVAASELCRGRGKGGGKAARSIAAAALVLAAGSVMASISTGNGATTVGPNDTALGDGSYANGAAGADATAIGHNVKTNAGNAFSIGSIIANDAASSIVMGNGGTNAVSMDAASSNTVFFAPNGGSVTNSANSFVFNPYGTTGTTGSSDSVNISGTVSNAANAVALGSKSSVSAANAVALGSNSVADQVDTVSVGSAAYQRKITNVKAGDINASSTDAVNGSQLAATNNTVADAVKYETPAHESVKLSNVGTPVTVTNVKAGDVSASSTDAVNGSQLAATNASIEDAVKYESPAHDSVKLGNVGTPVTVTNVKAGDVSASSTDAVNGAQLFGVKTQVDNNTTDIRNINSTINNITNGTVGIVTQDAATGNISVAGDTGGNLVNFAGTGGARQITGVKDGGVTATSTDAINGSQLYNTAASTAAALGGGAGVDENGGITAPTYTVGGTDVHDVGTAISNLDARTAQNTTDITNIGTATKNAVTYDSDSHNKVTLGGTAAADGTDENAVQLTNVKAGELSDTSTDAVNGAQLNATNARVDTFENTVNNIAGTGSPFIAINSSVPTSPAPTATGTDAVAIGANAQASGNNSVALGANSVANEANTASVGSVGNERRVTNVAPGQSGTDAANMNQINALRNEVGQNMTALQRSAYGGVASAMAMPSLSPREPGKTMVAVGVANYKGYGAVGAGATYRSRDGAWLINGALSVTLHGDTGARAQVGYEF